MALDPERLALKIQGACEEIERQMLDAEVPVVDRLRMLLTVQSPDGETLSESDRQALEHLDGHFDGHGPRPALVRTLSGLAFGLLDVTNAWDVGMARVANGDARRPRQTDQLSLFSYWQKVRMIGHTAWWPEMTGNPQLDDAEPITLMTIAEPDSKLLPVRLEGPLGSESFAHRLGNVAASVAYEWGDMYKMIDAMTVRKPEQTEAMKQALVEAAKDLGLPLPAPEAALR